MRSRASGRDNGSLGRSVLTRRDFCRLIDISSRNLRDEEDILPRKGLEERIPAGRETRGMSPPLLHVLRVLIAHGRSFLFAPLVVFPVFLPAYRSIYARDTHNKLGRTTCEAARSKGKSEKESSM